MRGRRPRVVFVSYFGELALGGQKTLLQLVEALHGEAIDAEVVVPAEGPMEAAMVERGVPVHRVRLVYPDRGVRRAALRSALALRRVLARGADVVYVDGPDHVLPVATAAFGLSARVLWHVQMSLPSIFDGENVRLADTLVLCSPALSERFKPYEVLGHTQVIVNSVDTARFSPEGPRADLAALDLTGRELVLSVGELSERKGTFDLVAAMAALGSRAPRAVLGLVGRGAPDVEARLRDAIAAAGLADRVRLLGYRDDIPALLRSASVVALPSHSEGLSLALLEAMATGAPVVASDILANRLVVEPLGEPALGVSYPVRDAEALAVALADLLDDPARAKALGERARSHVVAHHERSTFTRAFGEALTSAARAPRRPVSSRAWHIADAWRRPPAESSQGPK